MPSLPARSGLPGRAAVLVLALGLAAGAGLYLWTEAIQAGAAAGQASPETARALARAAGLRGSGGLWLGAGRQELDLALAAGISPEERQERLRRAAASLRAGLALAPLDPYGWADLALCLWLMGAPAAEAGHALERSLASGPAERSLIAFRLRLINALAPALTEEGRRAAAKEIELARRFRADLRGLINP